MTVTTVSTPNRNTRVAFSLGPDELNTLYSLFLWDMGQDAVYEDPFIDVTGRGTAAEYFFVVPPKELADGHPFATTIEPTLYGGKYIESHGSIFKNFSLSGTTGVRPNKLPKSPNAVDGRGLNADEVTGFDLFHNLRNLFLLYSDLQSRGKNDVVMVWRNAKDDDYYIVEPGEPKFSRTSKNPFAYTYTISFKGVAPFTGVQSSGFSAGATASSLIDPVKSYLDKDNFPQRVSDRLQTATLSYLVTLANANAVRRHGLTAVHDLLKPMRRFINLHKAVVDNAFGVPQALVETATHLLVEVDHAIEYFETIDQRIDERAYELAQAWRRMRYAAYSVLVDPEYKQAAATLRHARTSILNAYRGPNLGLAPRTPFTGGSPTYLGNNPVTSRVGQYILGENDTIRDVAQITLGDPRRWQEIVVLNDLRFPYVSHQGEEGILAPGDVVLFPDNDGADVANIGVQDARDQNYDNGGTSPQELLLSQTYGRDILLTSSKDRSLGDLSLTDFAINQRGDIATVVGTDNVRQAITLKFATERGDLKLHPYFGARYAIGSKGTLQSFNDLRVNILATLRSDDRIQNVRKLEVRSQGDVLYVNVDVLLVSAQEYESTTFALRRF